MPLVMDAVVVARDNSESPETGEGPAPLVEHAGVIVGIGELVHGTDEARHDTAADSRRWLR